MRKKMLLAIACVLLLVSTAVALEPGDTLWTRVYGGLYNESAFSVQQTTDGGYIAAGYSYTFGPGHYDVYLLKTDANGDTLWTRTYGDSDKDHGYSVQQTTDGGYVIAGRTDSFGGAGDDMFLVKTDANGDTLWTRTYDGTGGYECGRSVQQTTDGGYIVAGYTYFVGTYHRDFYLWKTDANGDTLWTRSYGGDSIDVAWCVQQTTDGGYIVVGEATSFGGSEEVWLLKTDANGDTLWTRTFDHRDDVVGRSVRQTTDGGYIVAGNTDPWGSAGDVYLLKTDADGNSEWIRTIGGREDNYGNSVDQTSDGGYIIVGYLWAGSEGWYDIYLVKTNDRGRADWTRTYGGSADDHGHFVRQTADGGYIVAGATRSFGAGAGDVYLLKIAGEEQGPVVSIEIVPDDPPVTVPQGGSFGFTGTLTNNTEETQVADVWIMATGPQKDTYGPFKEFSDVPLDPYETRSRHLNQHVPNLAPLGFYDYIAYCGDYPATVVDSSFFQIEVVAGTFSGGEDLGWLLSGSFDRGDDSTDLPSEFALLSNHPNPFNASTVIEYQLPEASEVTLQVYNLIGEKVATLVNGAEEAGYKSVTWDASEVSSGLYFYRLTADDFSEAKMMMLVK